MASGVFRIQAGPRHAARARARGGGEEANRDGWDRASQGRGWGEPGQIGADAGACGRSKVTMKAEVGTGAGGKRASERGGSDEREGGGGDRASGETAGK